MQSVIEQVETFGQTVTADAWHWEAAHFVKYTAYTTGNGSDVQLQAWHAGTTNISANVQFKNYRAVPAEQAAEFRDLIVFFLVPVGPYLAGFFDQKIISPGNKLINSLE